MSKTANVHYQKLLKARAMLDFVQKSPPRGDTTGIAVSNAALEKVKAWVHKQRDPIDDEALPAASQVGTSEIGLRTT